MFSPDGTRLAPASDDKTVQLWDTQKGISIGSALKGHSGRILSIVFSPKLASASYDKTVQLWDIQTGTYVTPALEGHSAWVNKVIFSPDGTKLASASGDSTV